MNHRRQDDYADIIDLPHPTSKRHPRMAQNARAAQFAPFAALSEHKDILSETQRITHEKRMLDEYKKQRLNAQLQEIKKIIHMHPRIEITYFEADTIKQGGLYRTESKIVKKLDEYWQMLVFEDASKVHMEDIYELVILP